MVLSPTPCTLQAPPNRSTLERYAYIIESLINITSWLSGGHISLQAFVEYQNEEQVEEISISSSKNVSLNLTLAWVS